MTFNQEEGTIFHWYGGFYRKFISNFSAIAAPLTDLTRKGQPNKVVWGDVQENAFITLSQGVAHGNTDSKNTELK